MKTKTCSKCKETKPVSEFRKKHKHLYQPYCIPCNQEYQREHYKKNRKRYRDQLKQRRKDYRRKVYMFLQEYTKSGCSICGETDFMCLEFDHRESEVKEREISDMIARGFGLSKIKKELEKYKKNENITFYYHI